MKDFQCQRFLVKLSGEQENYQATPEKYLPRDSCEDCDSSKKRGLTILYSNRIRFNLQLRRISLSIVQLFSSLLKNYSMGQIYSSFQPDFM